MVLCRFSENLYNTAALWYPVPIMPEIGRYRLGEVARRTGLRPETIRVWERRYGVVKPLRTPGGHRLYSERDVAVLRWLAERVQEGMRISQAVALWREQEAQRASTAASADRLSALRDAWVAACLAYDEAQAEQVLAEALATFPLEQVLDRVLRAGLHEVGERWYRGEATVEQEHFATQVAMRRLYALLAATPPPTRPGLVVLGTPSGELHSLPLLFLTLALRRRGVNAVFLGAELSGEHLSLALHDLQLALVVLGLEWLAPAPALAELAEQVARQGVPVVVVGRAFALYPDLVHFLPAYGLGELLHEAPDQVVAWLERPLRPAQAAVTPPAMWNELAVALRRYRSLLQEALRERLPQIPLSFWDPTLALFEAAVHFGRLEWLRREARWVAGMLAARGISPEAAVPVFWHALAEEVDRLVGALAKPFTTWLREFATEPLDKELRQ